MNHPLSNLLDSLYGNKTLLYKEAHTLDDWRELTESTHKDVWIALAKGSRDFLFMLKPRMVKMGNTEVVAPISEALHKQEVHCLEADGTVVAMFYDATNKEHQRLLLARSLFKRAHEAAAFHKAFISMLVYQ